MKKSHINLPLSKLDKCNHPSRQWQTITNMSQSRHLMSSDALRPFNDRVLVACSIGFRTGFFVDAGRSHFGTSERCLTRGLLRGERSFTQRTIMWDKPPFIGCLAYRKPHDSFCQDIKARWFFSPPSSIWPRHGKYQDLKNRILHGCPFSSPRCTLATSGPQKLRFRR